MKISSSKALTTALKTGVRKVHELDPESVAEFLDDGVSSIAVFVAAEYAECRSVRDIDYWESQTDSFESGLKVASSLRPGDRLFCAGVDSGSDPVDLNQLFYFVGPSAADVVKRLKKVIQESLAHLKDNDAT